MKLLFCASLLFMQILSAQVRHAPFVVVTPEKCGTHLLTKAITQLIDKECINEWGNEPSLKEFEAKVKSAEKASAFLHIHASAKHEYMKFLKNRGYRVIFLLRDPRDQVISLFHYILKGWKYGPYHSNSSWMALNEEEKLYQLITGNQFGVSATRAMIGEKLPWMFENGSFVLTLRFENLVGQEGGGSREVQLDELKKICAFLKLKLSSEELDLKSQNLFGKPNEKTFRNGQIGEWKEIFTPRLKSAMKAVFGNEMIIMGYEQNLNW